MTGKEALKILNRIKEIHNFLIIGENSSIFFILGILTEELSTIIREDKD